LLVVGLVQFALIVTILKWTRAHTPLAAAIPGDSDAEAETTTTAGRGARPAG